MDQTSNSNLITQNNVMAKIVHSSKSSLEVVSYVKAKKSRKFRYSIFASNAACDKWEVKPLVDKPRAIAVSVASGACRVGKECKKGGACWASDAEACSDDMLVRSINQTDEGYLNPPPPWENILYDTCEMFWKCAFSTNIVQVHPLTLDGVVQFNIEVFGNIITLLENHQYLVLNSTIMVSIPSIKTIQEEVNCNCLHLNNEGVCVTNEVSSGLGKGIIFLINSKCTGMSNNFHIEVPCNTVKEGSNATFIFSNRSADSGSSASLEGLQQVAIMAIYDNLQLQFNMISIQQMINKIVSTLNALISSSAKVDDFLIGRLLGIDGITTWLNETHARLCPCMSTKTDIRSNCIGNFAFSKGS